MWSNVDLLLTYLKFWNSSTHRRAIFVHPSCEHPMDESRRHNAAADSCLFDTRGPLFFPLVRNRGRGRGLPARNHLKWFERPQRAAH